MVTRIMAGAFLSCKNRVLLMKRGLHKKLGAGLWANIGGHLDLEDIKNPRALDFAETCYREIWYDSTFWRNFKTKGIRQYEWDSKNKIHPHLGR